MDTTSLIILVGLLVLAVVLVGIGVLMQRRAANGAPRRNADGTGASTTGTNNGTPDSSSSDTNDSSGGDSSSGSDSGGGGGGGE